MKKRKHHKEKDFSALSFTPRDGALETEVSPAAGSLMDRREFMKTAALGAAGVGTTLSIGDMLTPLPSPPLLQGAIPGPFPGRVVEVSHSEVVKELHQVDIPLLRKMMEKGIAELTGKNSLAEAWKMFVSSDDVVGIRLNCAGGPLCYSRPEMVEEIIRGLKLTGVKQDNIIV